MKSGSSIFPTVAPHNGHTSGIPSPFGVPYRATPPWDPPCVILFLAAKTRGSLFPPFSMKTPLSRWVRWSGTSLWMKGAAGWE
jgi:hypothetical protein